jgi:amino acid adenylation domain-containing protein
MEGKKMSGNLSVAAHQNIREKAYWLARLAGGTGKSCFPYDFSPAHGRSGDRESFTFRLTDDLLAELKRLSGGSASVLHMILTAGVVVLLGRYADRSDITVGTVIYKQEVEGPFVNTVLPLRIGLPPDMTFKELLVQVRQTVIEANEHYGYPMEILARQLGVSGGESGDFPLFDVTILLEDLHDSGYLGPIHTNLNWCFRQAEGFLSGSLSYNPRRYRRATIRQLALHFERTLAQGVSRLHKEVWELDFLSDTEKRRLLFDFNGADTAFHLERTMAQWFARQAEETPDAVALVGIGSSAVQLSYRALRQGAVRLARLLCSKGVGPNTVVALMMEPGLEMLTAIWGIWMAGGAYLPISPDYPALRVERMLSDSRAALLLTGESLLKGFKYIPLLGFAAQEVSLCRTPTRPPVEELDRLQMPDRSLIDYEKYRPYIGQAAAKNSITLQFSRGCVFNCAFCFKIWPHRYVVRSAENLFEEMQFYYRMGIRRFAFVDDLPNLDAANSARLYQLIIRHNMEVHLHFPNGIRGDILTKKHIDLMVEAGTVCMDLALETTSPRLQKLIRKNLKLERLYENIHYILKTYPQVMLELQLLHGIPTETEAEALTSLDFLKSLKWLHFPYIHVLNIYPQSDMAKIAVEHGVSPGAIERSADLAYHELPEILPFPRSFTRSYQMAFLNDYFLSRERLLTVLPQQMKVLTEDELMQKYNSYLPVEINRFADLLGYAGLERGEIRGEFLPDDFGVVPDLNRQLRHHSRLVKPGKDALRLLLLDLSQYFSWQEKIIYDVAEPPLGLLYLLTHLQREYPGRVNGKIAKSRIDFDSFEQLRALIREFDPQVIGVRSLNFYKDFFHQTVSLIRQWGITAPIIAGGPYATSSSGSLLKDSNVDLAVLGEGEVTFAELVGRTLENHGRLPAVETLKKIAGLAFVEGSGTERQRRRSREILLLDDLEAEAAPAPDPLPLPEDPSNLAYVIYTSGSTGQPRGVAVQHRSLVNQISGLLDRFNLDAAYRYLLLAAFTFDVSVMHICLPLVSGARLFLIADAVRKDPLKLWRFIHEKGIDILNIVPAYMEAILENFGQRDIRLRYLFVGGDVFGGRLLARLRQTFAVDHIVNIYGPTETTINAVLYVCTGEDVDGTIPIGAPLANYRAYILGHRLQLLPPYAPGELCIAGSGLARGYLNHPELTADKFVNFNLAAKPREDTRSPHHQTLTPKSQIPNPKSQILYRTGDLCRFLPDGNIEFLGRLDRQVKVRGFRIEPGEIERQLTAHHQVKAAAVVARQDEAGEKYLTAYIVPTSPPTTPTNRTNRTNRTSQTSPTQLRQYLAETLPDYMVPAHFVMMKSLPLTASGKVDTRALPARDPGTDGEYMPPRDKLEEQLQRLWAEVLGVERQRIGIDANFFKMGGHSLKATILIAKIQKSLDAEIRLVELFRRPTIRQLADLLRHTVESRQADIQAAEKREYYTLSSAQRRLYILQQMEPRSTAYHLTAVMMLEGEIDSQGVEAAFSRLIRRHESLRTSFVLVDGEPVQRVHPPTDFIIEYSVTEHPIEDFIRPFDLSSSPLRVKLVRRGETRHLFMLDIHHLVADGISIQVLVRDLMALYDGRELAPLKIQYKDVCRWQHSRRQQERLMAQEAYWLKRLAGELPVLHLPTDYDRPPVQSFEGSALYFQLSPVETEQLKALTSGQGCTLYMVLLALFGVFLSKLGGAEEVVVGTPVAGRRHDDLYPLIGMFVNTLVMRVRPKDDQSFSTFLRELSTEALTAFDNQEYPFEELVEKVEVSRDTGRNPLFDVIFALQNVDIPEINITGLKLSPHPVDFRTAKFDLSLLCSEKAGGLWFMMEYCSRLFKGGTIERFSRYFCHLTRSAAADPRQQIRQMELVPAAEKQKILKEFNDTRSDYPADRTIPQLFDRQVEAGPDRLALTAQLGQFSYRQLDRLSGHLARRLAEDGVRLDTLVAVMVERSVEMVVGILGILKAGCAYLPIDPDYPQERRQFMLADSGARILLDDHSLGQINRSISESDVFTQPARLEPTNLAYVLYTSGTTGRPKGVMVNHRSVVRLVKHTNYIALGPHTRLLQTGPLTFDASTFEIWGPLLNGGVLHIMPPHLLLMAQPLKDKLLVSCINTLWMTAPLFNQMVEVDIDLFSGLGCLLVGGDRLSPVHINRVRRRYPRLAIINGYGPTENTTFSTTFTIDREYEGRIPIGRPIANSTAYIADRHQHILPPGIAGELWVGGDGLSRGYLNNPDLTAEKFINLAAKGREGTRIPIHQILTPKSQILYRTGDLARFLPDGSIDFLGRLDDQVKIRGHRIEPAEIEHQLCRHPAIKRALVLTHQDEGKEKYLTAYIVPTSPPTSPTNRTNETNQTNPAKFRSYLAGILPDYMIPAHFILLDKIPLTANGKIDRRSLPPPTNDSDIPKLVPQTGMQRVIAEIWQEVLGRAQPGTQDNFFDLGGNSLDFIKVGNKLKERLNRAVSVVTLFTYPTIGSLARYLEGQPEDERLRQTDTADSRLIDEGKNLMRQTIEKLDQGD